MAQEPGREVQRFADAIHDAYASQDERDHAEAVADETERQHHQLSGRVWFILAALIVLACLSLVHAR